MKIVPLPPRPVARPHAFALARKMLDEGGLEAMSPDERLSFCYDILEAGEWAAEGFAVCQEWVQEMQITNMRARISRAEREDQ